jgi:hypothetical protein
MQSRENHDATKTKKAPSCLTGLFKEKSSLHLNED